ncbi:MAG: ribulokinase [Ruminococcaceae bacterium]|nr:ribulokinase [Oscillospiraceae bacterium]
MSTKYTVGIDFGTLSGRAVLVDVANGREAADCVMDYPHAVMDTTLPGTDLRLPPDFALQHPRDYLDVLFTVVPGVVKKSGVDPADIIGLCIDFTSCTLVPMDEAGTPLCFFDEFKQNPHAYVKLWKHHAAQPYANRINTIAKARGERWLARYGGKISSEWLFPKLWEIADRAPEVWSRMAYAIEAGDWLSWMLTGNRTRNLVVTGYKAIYTPEEGFPSPKFFAACSPCLADVYDKLDLEGTPVVAAGTTVGTLLPEMAEKLGLCPGIAISASTADAHVAAPALGCCRHGDMFGIFGTSACFMVQANEYHEVPGICGVIPDGLMPGTYGYEAGLCCLGDHFAWLAAQAPAEYKAEAEARGIPVIRVLIERAARLAPGESGILALNWWNGNRCILVDSDLSGLFVGMTLQTRPEELMRALIEATAFATRLIFDNFAEHGIPIHRFVAAGGIARKDPFTMQLYADVLGIDIRIAGSTQIPALGSAIYAAAAAGSARGGYDSVFDAVEAMQNVSDTVYHPNPEATAVYDRLYTEYLRLHDYFGRGENDVMKRLRAIRTEAVK